MFESINVRLEISRTMGGVDPMHRIVGAAYISSLSYINIIAPSKLLFVHFKTFNFILRSK